MDAQAGAQRQLARAHGALRTELGPLPRLVRTAGEGRADVAHRTGTALALLRSHLRRADAVVDAGVLNALAPRVAERDVAQRARVGEVLDRVDGALLRWAASGLPGDATELAAVLERLRAVLDEHLDDEEAHVLPLLVRPDTNRPGSKRPATPLGEIRS
jgi:hypothetical protein